MTTIDRLPTEVLLEIIRQSTNANFTTPGRWRAHVAALSLVARSWRKPAQSMLWADITCDDPGAVARCYRSETYGCYTTPRLHVCMVDARTAKAMIGILKGIQQLTLMWVSNLTGSIFEAPELAGKLIFTPF